MNYEQALRDGAAGLTKTIMSPVDGALGLGNAVVGKYKELTGDPNWARDVIAVDNARKSLTNAPAEYIGGDINSTAGIVGQVAGGVVGPSAMAKVPILGKVLVMNPGNMAKAVDTGLNASDAVAQGQKAMTNAERINRYANARYGAQQNARMQQAASNANLRNKVAAAEMAAPVVRPAQQAQQYTPGSAVMQAHRSPARNDFTDPAKRAEFLRNQQALGN